MLRKLILLISIFIISINNLSAQLSVDIYTYEGFPLGNVDTTNYPTYSAKVKVKFNNSLTPITKENIFIIENNYVSQPFIIKNSDADGWQEFSWITKMRGPKGGDTTPLPLDFVVTYNNMTSVYTGYNMHRSMAQVRVRDNKEEYLEEVNYGIREPGNDTSRVFYIAAAMAKIINSYEQPVRIDSIKTHSQNFTYEWIGSLIDKTKPPVNIISPFEYYLRIKFKPESNQYYRDKFTVYYEGNLKDEIVLIGNKFDIPHNTTLQLIQPNGEEIVPSCMDYEIKWKGQVKGIPTKVEYSTDNGVTWTPIANVEDSTLIWSVPKLKSEKALVRVKQEFQTAYTRSLRYGSYPVRSVTYRSDADKILAVYDDGKIVEWTLKDFTNSEPYKISSVNYPYEKIMPLGIEYFENNTKFALTYYKSKYGSRTGLDSVAFFNIGTYEPYLKVPIEAGFYTRKMFINPTRENLVLLNQLGTQLQILSLTDGSLVKKVTFKYPVSAFSFNTEKNEIAVALLNNEVQILDFPSFNVKKVLDFSDLPMIIELGLSPNSAMVAIGCKAPFSTIVTSNRNEIHVADINTGIIVRTIRNTASDPVGLAFSPSSSVMVVGSTAQPQIAFWDLPADDYIGSVSGNDGILTDFKFSPEGHSIVSSAAGIDNLTVRFFTYPEADTSDKSFRIVNPEMKVDSIKIEPKYIATVNEYEFDANFCNTSEVPIILDNAWLQTGIHYRLKNAITPDTVFPGKCIDIPIIYTPLDTGFLIDKLKFYSCAGEYEIGLQSYGKMRNISFYENTIDMGEFCVGSKTYKEVILAKNEDPVPLKINKILFEETAGSPFKLVNEIKDTVLQPGESIKINIEFYPSTPGEVLRNVVIYHSDQTKFKSSNTIKGFGLGASVQISHNDLVFIPEILSRKFTLKNLSVHDITVKENTIIPTGVFTVTSDIPKTLKPNDEMEFTVDWNGTNFQNDIQLNIFADPCNVNYKVNLGKFSGTSVLSLPYIEADPRGEATIPIIFNNVDYRKYNGIRFFETEIYINPRLFLPLQVTSDYGEATLVRNEIVNDQRVIGVRVEGNFPENGTVAYIKGVAGLAETDISPINFNQNSAYWGTFVTTTTNSGTFKLINLCEDRRILQNNLYSYIKSIIPNPVNDYFAIDYNTEEAGEVSIDIFDFLGNKTFELNQIKVLKGSNLIELNTIDIPNGSYTITIKQGSNRTTALLVVIK